MAVKLPAKKYKKRNPTQLRLSFVGEGGTTQFIDIAMALSILNQRSYAQGVYYYVNSVEMYNNENSFIDLHVLPDTWVTRAAWQRARRLWNNMNERALEAVGNRSIIPKYHDFKVYMSDLHRSTGTLSPKMFDVNSLAGGYSADEWKYSEFASADDDNDAIQQADNFFVHMLGPKTGTSANWTSIGVIESWNSTRARPQSEDPNTTLTATLVADPLANVADYSSEEQLNDVLTGLADDNDQPPYDHDNAVGTAVASMSHVARLATTPSTGRVAKSSGFCAPFGLICVDPQSTNTDWRIVLNLAQGTYGGVYAENP